MKKLNKLGIIAICVIILSALTTTATFSWLARPGATPVEGNSMELTASAVVKSDELSAETYLANLENGKLTTSGSALSNGASISVPSKGVRYFRTVVQNSSEGKNNFYLGGLELSSGTNLTVNCLSPLKTTASYSSGMAITEHLTVSANGEVNVEWYIYNGGNSAATINITTLPSVLSYN